jgi:hypothetical protein
MYDDADSSSASAKSTKLKSLPTDSKANVPTSVKPVTTVKKVKTLSTKAATKLDINAKIFAPLTQVVKPAIASSEISSHSILPSRLRQRAPQQ